MRVSVRVCVCMCVWCTFDPSLQMYNTLNGTYLVSSVTEDSHWSTRDTRLLNLGIWCIRHILNPNLFKLVYVGRGVNVCRYVGVLGMKTDIVRKIVR